MQPLTYIINVNSKNESPRWEQIADEYRDSEDVVPVIAFSDYKALQAENATLKKTISDLTKAYERESNDCLKALEERDYWYDKADALADKISEVFDVPIGEHSNVNCPIVEAMKILCGEYITKFDKENEEQAKRIAILEQSEAIEVIDLRKENERMKATLTQFSEVLKKHHEQSHYDLVNTLGEILVSAQKGTE